MWATINRSCAAHWRPDVRLRRSSTQNSACHSRVAIAAVHGGVKISDFTGNALKDPRVLAMAKKVVPVADAAFDWTFELPLGRVEIVTMDGRKLDRIGTNVPGSSEAPMTWDDIARKFGDCASVAAVPRSVAQIAKAQQMSRNLELLDDATELLRVLA